MSGVTDNASGHGHFYMGGENPVQFIAGSKTRPEPAAAPGQNDIWGTQLCGAWSGSDPERVVKIRKGLKLF